MQIKPIVYENLTPRQRVIATIEAEARDDQDEVQRLVKSCPKKNYRANDAAYAETLENLMNLALAVECDLRGNALALMTWSFMDEINIEVNDGLAQKLLQNIINTRTAWEKTLQEAGISPESMYKAVPLQSPFFGFIEAVLPDPEPETVAEIAGMMGEQLNK